MIAITREISPAINECELTFAQREPIDITLARRQHEEYERCLRTYGWSIRRLAASAEFPDSVFIEDAAVVLDELAIIARPGAEPRRGETAEVEAALRDSRRIERIHGPATLDGGDVLRIGRRLFVGLSRRTNEQAVAQLRDLMTRFGYSVTAVPVERCLHLKSAVTAVGRNLLLMNREWVSDEPFRRFEIVETHPDEPAAANALLLGEVVLISSSFPRTRRRLEKAGIETVTVDCSELEKAEGGVTCCALLVR